MNHSRKLNNKINRIHERALRMVYNDHKSTFEVLLSKDNSVTVHVQNIRAVMVEMFKIKIGVAPELMKDIFEPCVQSNYKFRGSRDFKSRSIKTVYYGESSLSFLGPKLWSTLPEELLQSKSLSEFQTKIKNWVPENCPCRLCKIYVAQIGFI